ncbi:MAG: hypothetical protein WD423_02625 [Rhodothermales bacterium]
MEAPISIRLALDRPQKAYSVDEAVDFIYRVHVQLESVELYRLKLKWWMGCVLTHTARPDGSRIDIVDEIAARLWAEHRIRAGRSVLYQCMKLYQGLHGDYARFEAWLASRKEAFHRPVYWYDVVEDLLGGRNNPAVIGVEEADERDYRDAERAMEAIERIILRAREGNEEAAGVLEGLRQNLIGLMLMEDRRNSTPRSAEYVRFVASYPCLACGRPSDAHHALGRGGTGTKPSDFGCIPLCREHHIALHQSGARSFERFYHVSLVEVALNLIHKFITGSWLTMHLHRHDKRGA